MYECLIKNRNGDGSTSYEYWCDEGKPRCPHVPIPEGAEYFICHEGIYNKELLFGKNNFDQIWSITFNQTSWGNPLWDDVGDRLEYMKEHYGSVVLWKREEEMKEEYPDDVVAVTKCYSTILHWYDDGLVSEQSNGTKYKPYHKNYQEYVADDLVFSKSIIYKREDKLMFEDKYLLTKLQACDVLLSRTSVLQYQSPDGDWIDFKPSANKSNAQLYVILFNLDDTKFRIKPEWEHIPIEFCEVMDMLADGKVNEIFVSKGNQLSKLEKPLYYLQSNYHDKYSRVVEKQITYDQWKNSIDLEASLK